MRDVAVVSYAQAPNVRRDPDRNEVEILSPVLLDVRDKIGIDKEGIDFVVSGSSDYLAGMPFSFVGALDAYGAWPPISESHVETDGAWALYEAWVKLLTGEIDTALVYAFGKSSLADDLTEVLTLQQDPYLVAPLWPRSTDMAALQARAVLDAGVATLEDLAAVAVRDRAHGADNPLAQLRTPLSMEAAMAEPEVVAPLRRSDCAPITDGASAVILAAGDRARELVERPAWIKGIDHRVEPHSLGARDLTTSESTRLAAEKASASGSFDVAELHTPFTSQAVLVEEALGLKGAPAAGINPSGGTLCANPVMVAGLTRIGEAAQRILDGDAGRTLAHATSGACLQQNLVCVMEGDA